MSENCHYGAVSDRSVYSDLVLTTPQSLTGHPAAVYLASLISGSRRTMTKALNAIASKLTNGEYDALTLNWAALRYQHTAAIRSVLMENYAPAKANRMLCDTASHAQRSSQARLDER